MIVEVWEVYKRDSQECCIFKTKELAENQTIFDEVDLISKTFVDLTDDEILKLNKGGSIYC